MRARADRHLALDRPDLVRGTAVRAPLVDRDLLADEVLVDRLGRLLDVALRDRVLDDRSVSVDRRRPDRERQLDGLDDPVEEQMALRRLQLLRVLLGVGEGAQVVLELLPHRALDCCEPLLLEQGREAGADLHPAVDVLFGRVHRQVGSQLVLELLDHRCALAQALGLDALPHRVPVRALELGGQLGVEPLHLADLAAQVLLRLAELADLLVRDVERLEEDVLGHLFGAGLDHRQAVLRADDDQVERRLLEVLLVRRVEDELAVDAADADGARPARRTGAARSSGRRTPR